MAKRVISMITVLCCALFVLCGCSRDPSNNKNAEEYGSPVDRAEGVCEARVMFVNVGKADCAIVDIGGSVWLVDTGT